MVAALRAIGLDTPVVLGGIVPSADRPELAAGGVDTVLQISIQGYGTKAAETIKPPVFLFLDAHYYRMRGARPLVSLLEKLNSSSCRSFLKFCMPCRKR